jgi:hypothetical protein
MLKFLVFSNYIKLVNEHLFDPHINPLSLKHITDTKTDIV